MGVCVRARRGLAAGAGTAEKQYKDAFDDEYTSLLARIAERAKVRLAEAEREAEREAAEARASYPPRPA